MNCIKVFKVGGSVLKTPADFMKIARGICSGGRKYRVCLVTSAMKNATNRLIKRFLNAVPQPCFWDFERFAGFGEIEASLLFESTFHSLGVKSQAVLPWMKEWPLFISLKNPQRLSGEKVNEKRDFRILKKTHTKIKQYIFPLFKDLDVIIVPGFIAKDGRGRIVTLGRGGSDISALLFSELLKARELILIKESSGILNLDPRLYHRAEKISSLNAAELGLLASSGAQVLNPISLKHQRSLKKMKVTDIRRKTGTEIYFGREITVKFSNTPYSVLTFVGNKIPETPGLLSRISSLLARHDISIYSITVSDNLIALYVEEERGEDAYRLLSPVLKKSKNLKFLNLKKQIGKILVRSYKFINEPGIIKKIVSPIAKEGINIWEVLTAHTDVMIFVEYRDLRKTYRVICNFFKRQKSYNK